MEVLDRDTLTLATAQRQLLAERRRAEVLDVVTHLIGLQAQEPHEPYLGLFARVEDTRAAELAWLLREREVARTHLMRHTVHLVSRADAGWLRALHEPMLRQRAGHMLASRCTPGHRLVDDDFSALGSALAAALADGPLRSVPAAERALAIDPGLATRFPGAGPRDLALAAPAAAPLVQVPPRGLWEERGPAAYATFSDWWGPAGAASAGIRSDHDGAAPVGPAARLVLRYLAAHGPASLADVRAFSGVTGLASGAVEASHAVVHYRDERGRTLLDLTDRQVLEPDGPGSPAALPVRYLPAFDNAVLGYHDRSRIIDDEHKPLSVAGARFVLVAGRVAATWTAEGIGGFVERAEVRVARLRRLSRAESAAVREEGRRVARFLGRRVGTVVLE